ncbi:hypothetical protein RHSIM_Rhsim12G0083900 [Rhododendron simsii]|uniref:Ubiquitin-like protease family profile domain-containing protein n=1 Tax=Rhododendron simsii TaxID=118357 RepID=A0A834L7Y7_RHOSS|nr:hypothetical protein RHSIM_Rhsim12G0083900 [Rhododendron simsii]
MYKNRGAKAAKKSGKIEAPGVGGCVLLLMLLYFDKEPMGMTVDQEGGPLIECWMQQRIQERVGKEENLQLLDPTLSKFPQPRLRHPQSDSDESDKGSESHESHGGDEGDESDGVDEGDPSDGGEVGDPSDEGEESEGNEGGEETKCEEKDFEPKDERHVGENQQGEEQLDDRKERGGGQRKDNEPTDEQVGVEGEEPIGLSKPSKRRPKRVLKRSQSRKTPYVAHPEVKESKYTNQENSVYAYLTKRPPKSDTVSVFRNEGIGWILGREQLQDVFKPRGHMSSMENLQKYETITNPSVLDDEVDPKILGYDLTMCSVLFLPVLLKSPKHWYVIAINQVDKCLEVLDSLSLDCQEKITANAHVISGLYKVLQRTRKNLHSEFHKWPIVHPIVPQQNNTHDCGFYVLRFMEHWTGGRFNTSQLEDLEENALRKRLLVRFVLSLLNSLRDGLLSFNYAASRVN